jgi:hypothetical protein
MDALDKPGQGVLWQEVRWETLAEIGLQLSRKALRVRRNDEETTQLWVIAADSVSVGLQSRAR